MDIELAQALEEIAYAKELLTRFVMASVYFNGKEADLVEEAVQFLIEPNDRFEVTKKGKEYLSSH
jgi:hypothetical protein